MTKGDKGRPSRGSSSYRAGDGGGTARREAKSQGWGCLAVAVVVVGGFLWGLFDGGVFDKKPDESAPMFGPMQVGRLVEQLSTAADAQGVCYGWVIDSGRYATIDKVTPSYPGTFRPHPPSSAPAASPSPRGTRSPATAPTQQPAQEPTLDPDTRETIELGLSRLDDSGVEFGSNLGPHTDPRQRPGQCPKWVILEADYYYSGVDDEYSMGSFEIEGMFGDGIQRFDEPAYERLLGQRAGDDIDGESGTARLRDAIGALPMLVANEGLAPPVPAQTAQASRPPANDKLAETVVTARRVWSVIGFVLIGCAVVCLVAGAVKTRRRSSS